MWKAYALLGLIVFDLALTTAGAGAVGNGTLIDDATPTVPTTTLPSTVQANAVDQPVELSPVQVSDTATADLAATLSAIATADMRQRDAKQLYMQKQMLRYTDLLADLHVASEADLESTVGVQAPNANTNVAMGWCCYWFNGNLTHPDFVLVPPSSLAGYVLQYPLPGPAGRAGHPINIPKPAAGNCDGGRCLPGGGKGGRRLLAFFRRLLAVVTGGLSTSPGVAADTTDVATGHHMLKTPSPPPPGRTSTTHTSQVHVPLRGRPAAGARKLAAAATTKG